MSLTGILNHHVAFCALIEIGHWEAWRGEGFVANVHWATCVVSYLAVLTPAIRANEEILHTANGKSMTDFIYLLPDTLDARTRSLYHHDLVK